MPRYYGPSKYPSITTITGMLNRYEGISADVLERKAKVIGKPGHKHAALVNRGIRWFPSISKELKPYMDQYIDFFDTHIEEVISYKGEPFVERPLVSEAHKFGGTPDFVAIWKRKRFPRVTEVKFTAMIDRIVRMQLAAQRQLVMENLKRKIDHTTMVIQIFPDRYNPEPIEDYEQGIQGFHYLLWLYNYLNGT